MRLLPVEHQTSPELVSDYRPVTESGQEVGALLEGSKRLEVRLDDRLHPRICFRVEVLERPHRSRISDRVREVRVVESVTRIAVKQHERRSVVPGAQHGQGRRAIGLLLGERGAQLRDRRGANEDPERKRSTGLALDLRHDLRGCEGVAAQREEVVVLTDRIDTQDVGPDRGEPALTRRRAGAANEGRFRQLTPVDLAVRADRELVERDQCRREHRRRQSVGERCAH